MMDSHNSTCVVRGPKKVVECPPLLSSSPLSCKPGERRDGPWNSRVRNALCPQVCAVLWLHHMTLRAPASAVQTQHCVVATGAWTPENPAHSRPLPSWVCRRLCSWITRSFPEIAILSRSLCQLCASGAPLLLV